MTENDSLSAKQAAFVLAYLTPGLTIEAAARAAGIGEKTAYRYLRLAQVQAGIKAARADLYEHGMSGLLHLVEKSVQALERNLADNPLVPCSTQVRAASIVLEQATVQYKTAVLEQRIAELEQMVKDRQI